MSLTMRGLLFLALIAGGECARVNSNIIERAALNNLAGWPFGGNEVCREPEVNDEAKMLKRWTDKANKMKALAETISESCDRIYKCPLKIKTLGQRVKMWDGCFKLRDEMGEEALASDGENSLSSLLFGNGENSMTQIFADVQEKLDKFMLQRDLLPRGKGDLSVCHANIKNLDLGTAISEGEMTIPAETRAIPAAMRNNASKVQTWRSGVAQGEAAAAIEIMRLQIFGQECNRGLQKRYIASLQEDVRRALNSFDAKFMKVISDLKMSEFRGGPEQVAHEVINSVVTDDDLEHTTADATPESDELEEDEMLSNPLEEIALTQLDETTGDGGASAGTVLLVLLIIAIVIFLLVCFRGYFGIESGSHGISFSGGGSVKSCFK